MLARRAIVAILLLTVTSCREDAPPPRDQELKATLAQIRGAIRAFHQEHGRYPHKLEELIPKHLPRIPVDPITGSAASWRVITEETVVPSSDFTSGTGAAAESFVIDVQSGAGPPHSSY